MPKIPKYLKGSVIHLLVNGIAARIVGRFTFMVFMFLTL